MPKKNAFGKWILPAGEVGQYAICPESWRLKMVERVRRLESSEVSEGEKRHEEWSAQVDTAVHLRDGLRFVLALALTMITIMLLH